MMAGVLPSPGVLFGARRPRRGWRTALFAAALLSVCTAGPAIAEPVVVRYVSAELASDTATIRPDTPFTVGVVLRSDPGWHVYWRNPGHTGLPTRIDWRLPEGFRAAPLQWPYPARFGELPLVTYGYEGSVVLMSEITPPAGLHDGQNIDLRARVSWLVCRADACVPGKAEVSLRIAVSGAQPQPDSRWTDLFDTTRAQIPRALANWTSRADVDGDKVVVALDAPAGAQPPSAAIDVFANDNDLVDPDVAPRITRAARGVTIELARSKNDKVAPATLALVLVARDGWDGDGRVQAIEVSAPVHASVARASEAAPREAGTAAAARPPDAAAPRSSAAAPAQPPAPGASAAPVPGASRTIVVPQVGATNLTFVLALVFAFAGGLILNLMPCVFPVLSLKIVGFVHVAHNDSARVRRHGIAFAAGVLVSFWILAALLLVLRAGGQGLGWGFQLQQPWFVAALALLLFGLSLNLLGVFEIGSSLIGAAGRFDSRTGYHGSFLSGVLATVLATPCSAPFMGAALGYALVQPPAASLAIFTFLGLGMAAPYVLLSFDPWLLRRLPKPGAWMETLRQAMAFPLLATVIWLVWVFGQQVGNDAVMQLLAGLLLLAIGIWIGGHFAGVRGRGAIVAMRTTAAACMLLGVVVAGTAAVRPTATECAPSATDDAIAWVPYDAQRLAALRSEGRAVFLDFTAAWCLSCKVNERLALGTPAVRDRIRELDIVAMKGDWTNGDPAITDVLASFGRSAVPLYVFYPRGRDSAAIVLPAILSTDILLSALERVDG